MTTERYTEADHERYAELQRRSEAVRAEVEAAYAQAWRDEWAAPFRFLARILRRKTGNA